MGTISEAVLGTIRLIRRIVVLEGLTPIMFDRYPGDNDTKLEAWQKLYLSDEKEKIVGLPSLNILSFLSSQNTKSAPKLLLDPRKYRKFTDACRSYVFVAPEFIPFTRNGEKIRLGTKVGVNGEVDPGSGIHVMRNVARLKDGIPNPKVRPILPLPWSLQFTLSLYPNREIQETQIANVMREGGIAMGLGSWRGVYGKFLVSRWDDLDETAGVGAVPKKVK